jgi:hypothetical protein
MPLLETAYLLNPGKRRKARRTKGSARRSRRSKNARGWFKKRGKSRGGFKRRFRGGTRFTRPTKATRRKSRRARRGGKRKGNPSRVIYRSRPVKRSRRKARRSWNPGNMAGALKFPGQVIPFTVPIPGLPGQIANGIVQGVAAGAVVFTGYLISGALVNYVVTKEDAAMALAKGENFKGKWARPLLHGATAGLIGAVTAMIAPAKNKATWALLAAAGPGLRALGGIVQAIMPRPAAPGLTQDIHDISVGLADYLQVGALYEAGMGDDELEGDDSEELSDYLQVGQDESGMEDLYEAGMGAEESEESLV